MPPKEPSAADRLLVLTLALAEGPTPEELDSLLRERAKLLVQLASATLTETDWQVLEQVRIAETAALHQFTASRTALAADLEKSASGRRVPQAYQSRTSRSALDCRG